ncbi:MAG: choice-of-anchor Q domain-containing protein [Pyrinomonadaceae bacterium]
MVTRSDDRDLMCQPADCSLREAVKAANMNPGPDSILFATGLSVIQIREITFAGSDPTTILGPGANVLEIRGMGARLFQVDGANLTLSGLSLAYGASSSATSSGVGGAILGTNSTIHIDGVYLHDNRSDYMGGAIGSMGTGDLKVINSTFYNNSGCCGGAIISETPLTVDNSTIYGNVARDDLDGGGAIQAYADLTIRNSTITDNRGDLGGGVVKYNLGKVTIGNSIIAGNRLGPSGCYCAYPEMQIYPAESFLSLGGNIIGDNPGDAPTYVGYQITDRLDIDPILGALQNNGGPMPTVRLLAGSPAIDRGIDSIAEDAMLISDQRGSLYARIADGDLDGIASVDIGAFELRLRANVNGRVLTATGLGLRNATVTLMDMQSGVIQNVTTSSFGYYAFENIPVDRSYTIAVGSRRFRFAPRNLQLVNDLTGIDFIGGE